MSTKDFTFEAEVDVQMENDDVFFVGEAITDNYISLKMLQDINENFVNQPVIYRHDHPAKGKGGSIYGRVVESKIVEKENGTHAIRFKSKMKNTLKKHRDLIELAQTQQELGKPIRYSVGFLNTKTQNIEEADVYEVSLTNDPVCEECETINIMEKEIMTNPDGEVQKEVEKEIAKREAVIEELQEKFEESIDFKKELEKEKELNSNLAEKVANYEKILKESKERFEEAFSRVAELEKRADLAERVPLVEKIFTLERNDLMKERYLNRDLWSVDELVKQYEKIKELNKDKINVQKATTRTLEQSRYKVMDSDFDAQAASEFEAKMKSKLSPELKKALGWE